MSFLKAAIAVAAVAGVGYVGYKACKNKTARKIAGAVLDGMAASSTHRTYTRPEPVVAATVTVTETDTTVYADKSKMEGVMGVAAHVKKSPVQVTVSSNGLHTDIEVERTQAGFLDQLDDDEMPEMFGFDGPAFTR